MILIFNKQLNFRMEGQLYKYTNVVRGFQVRYFKVNNETAKLDYYMVRV